MEKIYSITKREINFLITTAMIFSICEVLSIEFNQYFNNLHFFGIVFPFNVSVAFFCFSFFIMDLVTEIYDNTISDFFIYAKLISQFLFAALGNLAVYSSAIPTGQLQEVFLWAPYILFSAMVASFFGYKVTGRIMQGLKVRFNGQFLFSRYLSSTLTGEILCSVIFSVMVFKHGRSLLELVHVFMGLIVVKLVLSFIFSLIIVPLTTAIRSYLGLHTQQKISLTI